MSDVIQIERVAIAGDPKARALAYLALTKPRIGVLVLMTMAVGFYVAAPHPASPATLWLIAHAILGVGLAAGGANTINQYLEMDFDRLMVRTANRPLSTGILSPVEALVFGVAISVAGVVYLGFTVNELAASITAATVTLYTLVYTPFKRMSPLCVHVGAVAGALPPMIGWAAATGTLSFEAWTLFAIMYFWQLPHFAAIAWQYREDYARAGYPMLPVIDPQGLRLGAHVVNHTVGLIIASLFPVALRMSSVLYAVVAIALGLTFLASGIRFLRIRTAKAARTHVLASIIYLPVLLLVLVFDKLPL
ncbi:MAG: protoheme IX farnesyltransferase [Planctomycetes bacterium]|nr:protoheme IX farnesyltransferase [Planctomycetota bacterium]MBI3833314.1 protoheme IX farnesyltransferase [Planctomycetota bacterium]